jgi:putative SOS response-associated peptidase YedK
MPVCLPAEGWGDWLDRRTTTCSRPRPSWCQAPEDLLEVRPVGPSVGNAANDGPELLAEV